MQLTKATVSHYVNARLADDWIPTLKKRQLFKMFVPQSLGGLELSLESATHYLKETAEISGSLGWIHNLAAGANFFCGYFDAATAAEIYTSHEVLSSGSGAPSGSIRRQDDHLLASGRWNFCSGAGYATHFTATALDEQEKPVTFISDAGRIHIREHWRAFGLKASSTRQIEMKDKKVPARYQFQIGRQKSFFDYSIYQIDFETFARICLSATWEGILHGFLNYLDQEQPKMHEGLRSKVSGLRDKAGQLEKTRSGLIQKLQKNHYNINTPEVLRRQIKTELGERHRDIYLQISPLCWELGLHITDEENCSHWALRDLKTASQHFFVK